MQVKILDVIQLDNKSKFYCGLKTEQNKTISDQSLY